MLRCLIVTPLFTKMNLKTADKYGYISNDYKPKTKCLDKKTENKYYKIILKTYKTCKNP